jgi:hypothetical protein
MENRVYAPDYKKAQMEVLLALAGALKELKEVPDGVFYAQTMSFFPSLDLYNNYIQVLIDTDMVKRKNNVLYWVGK